MSWKPYSDREDVKDGDFGWIRYLDEHLIYIVECEVTFNRSYIRLPESVSDLVYLDKSKTIEKKLDLYHPLDEKRKVFNTKEDALKRISKKRVINDVRIINFTSDESKSCLPRLILPSLEMDKFVNQAFSIENMSWFNVWETLSAGADFLSSPRFGEEHHSRSRLETSNNRIIQEEEFREARKHFFTRKFAMKTLPYIKTKYNLTFFEMRIILLYYMNVIDSKVTSMFFIENIKKRQPLFSFSPEEYAELIGEDK